jgi:2-keto-4-pentenoate hydratase/2-oxohepta-3-ene-1,7-dioic acid hydratase in catechol pathway
MRIARIAHPGGSGLVFAAIGDDPDGQPVAAEIADQPFSGVRLTGRMWPLADVRLMAPILPSKIVCIGKNYAEHAREMGGEAPANPVIFLKPPSSVIGPNAPIRLPADSERVDYEGELAVVIGLPPQDRWADGPGSRDVPPERAAEVIFGYTVANDVTARDQQQADGQWARAKGHDTFCPLGPWIETELDPSDLMLTTELDGEVKQRSRTSLLLHDVPALIHWISRVMTLLPGDVILTGTPAGVGPMRPGQSVSVTVDGIGTLTNPVAARE